MALAQSVPAELLVLTQARSRGGQAGALHLHRLSPNGLCNDDIPLPGTGASEPILSLDGAEAWTTIDTGRGHASFLISLAPLAVMAPPALGVDAPAHISALGYGLIDELSPEMLLHAPGDTAIYGVPRGRASEGPYAVQIYRKDFGALALAAAPFGGHCAVLLYDEGQLRLRILETLRGAEQMRADLGGAPGVPELALVAADASSELVAVAVTAPMDSPADSEATDVWIIPATHALASPPAALHAIGAPLPNRRNSLCFSGPDTLWLVTRLPETRFGYLTQWCLVAGDAGGSPMWEKSAEHLVRNMPADAVMLPTGPPLNGLLLAQQQEVSLWTGAGVFWRATLGAQAEALAVAGDFLMVGAGNAISMHVSSTGERMEDLQFQTGHVTAIAVLDAAAESPAMVFDADRDGIQDAREIDLKLNQDNPDSDGDGIADGLDAEPARASPALLLPDSIIFSGKAAGNELRGLSIASANGKPLTWRATFDKPALPWLRVYPTEGTQDTPLYIGVDPVEARRGELAPGVLAIEAAHPATGVEATASPAFIHLSVSSSARAPRLAVWLYPNGADAKEQVALRDVLSSPPLFLSHLVHTGPHDGVLDGVDVVIAPLAAAAQGVLSQRAAMDYLMQGGAMLLTGAAPQAADLEYLSHWGEPLGLEVEGGSIALEDAEDAQGWRRKALGKGRLALAPTLREEAHGELIDLFDWLCRAGREVADLDADGLADTTEDADGNGQHDFGETHMLLTDSDGDGLPDGMEDANANGRTEAEETSPTLADTDDDGVSDAADTE